MTKRGTDTDENAYSLLDFMDLLDLGPALGAGIARIGCWRRVPPRCRLFEAGDGSSFLFGLVEGAVDLVAHGEAGDVRPRRRARSPCWIGADAVLSGRAHDVTATVVDPAQVCVLDADRLHRLLMTEAAGARAALSLRAHDAALWRDVALGNPDREPDDGL